MSLKDLMAPAVDKTKPASKGNNTFGLVLRIATCKEVDGQMVLTGFAHNTNSHVSFDEPVEVTFRGNSGGRSVSNFEKGNGKKWRKDETDAANSIVTIENCYVVKGDGEGPKKISGRWLQTVRSIHNREHEDRSTLEGVLASPPTLQFANANPKDGEPASYTLPIVGDKARGRVQSQHGTFLRSFPLAHAVEKLKEATEVKVRLLIVEPKLAVKVESRAELEAALREQLGRGTSAVSVLRLSDGESCLTRNVHVSFKKDGDQYVPDVEKAVTELFANNVFANVEDTDRMLAGVASGAFTLEVVPAYSLQFAGNATQDNNISFKIVSDVKNGNTVHYESIFGNDADRFAPVILPGMLRNGDTIGNFQPINMIADEHGTFGIKDFPTPHIASRVAAAPAPVPEEDADPSHNQTPGDLADSFDRELADQPELELAGAPSP